MEMYPENLMEHNVVSIKIDKYLRNEEGSLSSDEPGADEGNISDEEPEADGPDESDTQPAMKKAKFEPAAADEKPQAGSASSAAHDEANLAVQYPEGSPESWDQLKGHSAMFDPAQVACVVMGWKPGLEPVDRQETEHFHEPFGCYIVHLLCVMSSWICESH
jgi:hypothetical protein